MTVFVPHCFADRASARCPCDHNPEVGKYPNPPCDHGWTRPGPAATTAGTHGPGGGQVAPGARSDTAAAKCRTCAKHAREANR